MTGANLREWRNTQKLTQRAAAEALGVSLRTIQHAEAGRDEPLWPELRERFTKYVTAGPEKIANPRPPAAPAPSPPAKPSPPPSLTLDAAPPDLATALQRADSAEELWELEKRIARDSTQGALDLELAAFLLDACRELRQTLKIRNLERGRAKFMELELLTLDEEEALLELGAKRTPRALEPGEGVPPPAQESAP